MISTESKHTHTSCSVSISKCMKTIVLILIYSSEIDNKQDLQLHRDEQFSSHCSFISRRTWHKSKQKIYQHIMQLIVCKRFKGLIDLRACNISGWHYSY